jgi:hypothetical protein
MSDIFRSTLYPDRSNAWQRGWVPPPVSTPGSAAGTIWLWSAALDNGMDSVVGAIVAVAGTMLGSTATYLFQRSLIDRQERVARADCYCSERLATYVAFVAASSTLRGD